MGLTADLDHLEDQINQFEAKLGGFQQQMATLQQQINGIFDGGAWGGIAATQGAAVLFPGKRERLQALIDRLNDLLGDYRSILSTLSDVIQVIAEIVGFFSDAWDWAAGAASDLVDGVVGAAEDIVDGVGDFVDDIF
ncbi:MAG: hypothetical protein U0528_04610 [Anaerolineae bacterium]|nr:hypothetical protein [Anaerolineae bacterium]